MRDEPGEGGGGRGSFQSRVGDQKLIHDLHLLFFSPCARHVPRNMASPRWNYIFHHHSQSDGKSPASTARLPIGTTTCRL